MEKEAKKQRKVEYHSQRKRKPEEDQTTAPPLKKRKLTNDQAVKVPVLAKEEPRLKPKVLELKEQKSQMEVDEENEIAWLEYQLGMSKDARRKPGRPLEKILAQDGLDGMLLFFFAT